MGRFTWIFLAAACMAGPVWAQQGQVDGALDEVLENDPGVAEFAEIPIDGLTVERLTGAPILAADGEVAGEVADVVEIEDGPDKIVMAVEGPLDMGGNRVLIPLGDVRVRQDEGGENLRVETSLSAEMIERLPPFDGA